VYFFLVGGSKITKTVAGKLRTLGLHEKPYFLMNGSLQTGNEIETEVKIYGNDFCIENFFNPDNGKLYMSGFVCINDAEERFAPTQRGFYHLFLLKGSISSTFYVQLLRPQIPKE
jgi:hypothetical protein